MDGRLTASPLKVGSAKPIAMAVPFSVPERSAGAPASWFVPVPKPVLAMANWAANPRLGLAQVLSASR